MTVHANKHPKRRHGLSWGKSTTEADVTYRLYRRDHDGRVHSYMLSFRIDMDVTYIAQRLRAARHTLRDRVDEIDLAAMGVIA